MNFEKYTVCLQEPPKFPILQNMVVMLQLLRLLHGKQYNLYVVDHGNLTFFKMEYQTFISMRILYNRFQKCRFSKIIVKTSFYELRTEQSFIGIKMAIKCIGQTFRTRDVIQTSRGCRAILFRMLIVLNSQKYIDKVVRMHNLAIDFSKAEIISWACINFYKTRT